MLTNTLLSLAKLKSKKGETEMKQYKIAVYDTTKYIVNVVAESYEEAEEMAIDEVFSSRYDEAIDYPLYAEEC